MTERNSTSIDRLTDRIDRQTSNIDRLAVSQLNTEERVDQLTVYQVNLEETMNRFIQNAEADRTVMREIQTEVRGLQIENRRIMDHLFGQQGGTHLTQYYRNAV